jgi:hypothetical protein
MKMEIELTDEQAEKVEILKSKGIEVGDAIDMLFDMKDKIASSSNQILDRNIEKANREKAELEEKLAKVDAELSLFDKLKDNTLNYDQKQQLVESQYSLKESNTIDKTLHDKKLKFSWSKLF